MNFYHSRNNRCWRRKDDVAKSVPALQPLSSFDRSAELHLGPMWVRKMPRKDAQEIAMHYVERVKIP
jgi:hypothetical protein